MKKLPHGALARLAAALASLASEPRPPGVKKLSGKESLFRVRVGDYRIIYQVRDRELVVLVLKIGHRREIYRS